MKWAASSEMLVMLAVLAFLVWELVSVRRTLRRDRAKLAADKQAKPAEVNAPRG